MVRFTQVCKLMHDDVVYDIRRGIISRQFNPSVPDVEQDPHFVF